MTFIREHALERFWLERRLECLSLLDDFANQEFYNEEPEDRMSPDDPKLTLMKNHYKDVINPYELNETLKRVYPPHQYGPEQPKE